MHFLVHEYSFEMQTESLYVHYEIQGILSALPKLADTHRAKAVYNLIVDGDTEVTHQFITI